MGVVVNQGRAGSIPWRIAAGLCTSATPLYKENEIVPLSLDLYGRLRIQWHANLSGSKHYVVEHIASGSTTAGTNMLGARKLLAGNVARIYRIDVILARVAAAGLGVPLRVYRASGVGGGTLIPASEITRKDTLAPAPTLEVRSSPTGTKAARQMFSLGGSSTTGASLAGPQYTWRADREEEEIVLRGTEGIIIDIALAGDIDDRYHISLHWRED